MDGPEGIVRDESRSGGPQHRDRQLGHRPLFLEQTKLITLLSAFVSTSSFSLRSTIEVSTQMTIYYEELPDSITREFEHIDPTLVLSLRRVLWRLWYKLHAFRAVGSIFSGTPASLHVEVR
jgi:hypothetical protein